MSGYPLNLDSATLPGVNPSGAPGGDYENIQVSPDMFGARVGRAMEGLGEGVERVSNTGFQVAQQRQEMQDRTKGAELHSDFSNRATDLSVKFLELKGGAAQSALSEHKANLDSLYKDTISQAPDPYTKQLVTADSSPRACFRSSRRSSPIWFGNHSAPGFVQFGKDWRPLSRSWPLPSAIPFRNFSQVPPKP